jgi:hypothetical protein
MKSNVSYLLEIAQNIYKDACAGCIADVSDKRDLITIISRVKHEGISFLTITLPGFAKDFERSLAAGFVDSACFKGFERISIRNSNSSKAHGAIPVFLQGMLSHLFDKENGRYVQNSNSKLDAPNIVGCVRQICLAFKKLELPCLLEREQVAIHEFEQVEHDFSLFALSEEDEQEFAHISTMLWDNLIGTISLDECIPRHGPGATADGRSGNRKYIWRNWYQRIEPYFPLVDSCYSISVAHHEGLELVNVDTEEPEIPVKVSLVPKTMKSPRIIAIEPCCMQFVQQGIRHVLYERIESYWMTAGHVNFTDQSINQQLALTASMTGQFSTIDLSEASDRVPRSLALLMFRSNPDFRDAIDACRSTHAILPDGSIIGPLKKFASMGSALCFPIESMYFYTICIAALMKDRNLPVNHENVFQCSRDVYVYGDDIVVPTRHANVVLDYLQKYNCKINLSKTFLTGKFRESCGLDAFDGTEVTPTYVRRIRPENRQQSTELISWVKTANLFYKRGYWSTASTMFKVVEGILGLLPWGPETASYLCKTSFQGYLSFQKWFNRYQAFGIKAWVPEPIYRTDILVDYAALQKSLAKLEGLVDLESARDESHLERSALHGEVALKHRWVLVY